MTLGMGWLEERCPQAPVVLLRNPVNIPQFTKLLSFPLISPYSCHRGWGAASSQGNMFSFCFFSLFCFLGPHPWHTKVPRLGVESELQLPAYTTATATLDLQHSLQQRWILNPLNKAGD